MTVTWRFHGQTGSGEVTVIPTRVGDFAPDLVAQGPYGATATAAVRVHVVKRADA